MPDFWLHPCDLSEQFINHSNDRVLQVWYISVWPLYGLVFLRFTYCSCRQRCGESTVMPVTMLSLDEINVLPAMAMLDGRDFNAISVRQATHCYYGEFRGTEAQIIPGTSTLAYRRPCRKRRGYNGLCIAQVSIQEHQRRIV